MTKPVDLDALDDAHAALGKILPDYWQEDGGDATLAVIRTIYEEEAPPRGDDEESDAPWYWARNEAGWIATKAVEILNAYPAMAAELRALREVAEAARAFLPTCERVICGGATTRECGAAATHESQFGVVLCDLHRSNVPRPLDPHPRVDALRAAIAKVPR